MTLWVYSYKKKTGEDRKPSVRLRQLFRHLKPPNRCFGLGEKQFKIEKEFIK